MNLNKQRRPIFFFVLVLVIVAFITIASIKSFEYTLLFSLLIIAILYLSRHIWLPDGIGKSRIRRLSLWMAVSTVSLFGFWPTLKSLIIENIVAKIFPEFNHSNLDYFPTISLVFILVVIWIVNYYMRDSTLPPLKTPIQEEIKTPNFLDSLKSVCESLAEDVRSIDIRTNWSAKQFVPLEAEVEIQTKNGSIKKVTDLLSSIRKSNDRLFLVLGDPGSGKSVALRKLALDLASEVNQSGRIPIYINLKEWHPSREWTPSTPPTVEEFGDFVKKNVINRDIVTAKFFRKYYDDLYISGRLYFILDSFDEMPAVLDEADGSPLIKELSHVLFKFLKGARHESQGILASRIFRKPTKEFQTKTTLELRPFTEEKIIKTLEKSELFDVSLIQKLFKKRLDLVPISRNPFTLALISDYVEKNNNALPENQSALYESYIQSTFDACADRIARKNLTIKSCISQTKTIAKLMFDNYGFEVPINELRSIITEFNIDDIIDILVFSRIGRKGTGDSNQFSFVHRRFCEYFAVQSLIDSNSKIDFDSIPNDSQWRDALVFYCEVVDENEAIRIAQFCWSIISKSKDLRNKKALHCLRFLNDAFKGRKTCLSSFQAHLGNFIDKQIFKENNILSVKYAIESVGLLNLNDADKIVANAFDLSNSWLNETCVKSCRHLGGISDKLQQKLIIFIDDIGSFEFMRRRKNLKFSLSLSEGFSSVLKFYNLKLFGLQLLFSSMLLSIIVAPLAPIFSFAFLFFVLLVEDSLMHYIPNRARREVAFIYFRTIFFGILGILIYQNITNFGKPIEHFFNSLSLIQNPLTHLILSLICFFGSIPYFKIAYAKVLYKRPKLKIAFFFIVALILVGTIFVIVLNSEYKNYLIGFLTISSIVISLAYTFLNLIPNWKMYKNINQSRLNDRKYIYRSYMQFNEKKGLFQAFFQMKLAMYIRDNINEVKGSWPNDDILQVSNRESDLIIAKKEEQWLSKN